MINQHKEYTVEKATLIATLKVNRERHISVHRKAMDEWRKRSIEELAGALKLAEAGERFKFPSLRKPVNYSAEYDKAIGLLEMAAGATTTITVGDYQHFILDQWPWAQSFATSNAEYVGGAGMRAMGFDTGDDDE